MTGPSHGACPPPPRLAPLRLLPLHHPEDALLSQPGRSMSAAGTPSPQSRVRASRASALGLLPSTVRTALSSVSFKSLSSPCCCDLPKSTKIHLGKGSSPLKGEGLNMETPREALKPNSVLPTSCPETERLEQILKLKQHGFPSLEPPCQVGLAASTLMSMPTRPASHRELVLTRHLLWSHNKRQSHAQGHLRGKHLMLSALFSKMVLSFPERYFACSSPATPSPPPSPPVSPRVCVRAGVRMCPSGPAGADSMCLSP